MKRLIVLAAGIFLSTTLIGNANAAPPKASKHPPQQQGVKNAKKAMQGKLERDRKIYEVRKKGQAMRKQAQRGT